MTRPLLRMLPATLLLAAGFLQAAPPESAPSRRALQARAEPTDAAADADWILRRLARPAPMRTGFVELRGSRLLKKPLRLEGEYRRPQDDTLVREVTAPYAETTTIRAGEVLIARGDKPPRRFSLSRAPELAGLQDSFGALLAGDRVALERSYRLAADGTRARWTLTLTPREAALAARLQAVTLYGQGAELRCIETQPVRGDAQRTLLAGAAQAARGVTAAGVLATLCYGGHRSR